MRVTIFTGSPRKKGNTAAMANLLAQKLSGAKIETEIVDLYDHNIQPCQDCRNCKHDQLICTRKDGMPILYEKMEEADVLVFGTPIYWFGPSGQTKMMIDRFRPYFVNKKLYGKKAALLIPSASGEEDTDLTIEQFSRVFKALGMEYLDTITIKAYEEGDVLKDERIHDFIIDLKDRILETEKDII